MLAPNCRAPPGSSTWGSLRPGGSTVSPATTSMRLAYPHGLRGLGPQMRGMSIPKPAVISRFRRPTERPSLTSRRRPDNGLLVGPQVLGGQQLSISTIRPIGRFTTEGSLYRHDGQSPTLHGSAEGTTADVRVRRPLTCSRARIIDAHSAQAQLRRGRPNTGRKPGAALSGAGGCRGPGGYLCGRRPRHAVRVRRCTVPWRWLRRWPR